MNKIFVKTVAVTSIVIMLIGIFLSEFIESTQTVFIARAIIYSVFIVVQIALCIYMNKKTAIMKEQGLYDAVHAKKMKKLIIFYCFALVFLLVTTLLMYIFFDNFNIVRHIDSILFFVLYIITFTVYHRCDVFKKPKTEETVRQAETGSVIDN